MTKSKKKNEWVEWIKAIVIAIVIAFLLRNFVFATSIVDGDSMAPTLENGERVVFNKFSYLIGDPEHGDIVIIQRPQKNYVKRIIGLPGETIEIVNHDIYINGKKYEENFVNKEAKMLTGNFGPIKIPEGSYFVMGDNRAISKDSRNGLGFISRDDIIGRSEFIIFPFNEWALTR
ncbi:signal peptidase I [Virgibacillus alimentarius]|uniref:Signal peptidase I n=1 Tax=Virgibacillus alimentarius TaxID=698769 RepID=A0ABS4S698_9BACI|nr:MULTISPECIES: signal peptidase I [Virgibacillus]MBP2256944.1 signal peptidase I [Virgibacillus alimentarius]HLR68066.1 signal peptidase I [Virgibacillus sp.]